MWTIPITVAMRYIAKTFKTVISVVAADVVAGIYHNAMAIRAIFIVLTVNAVTWIDKITMPVIAILSILAVNSIARVHKAVSMVAVLPVLAVDAVTGTTAAGYTLLAVIGATATQAFVVTERELGIRRNLRQGDQVPHGCRFLCGF